MKKLGIIIALLLLLTLVACGSSTSTLVTNECTDQTASSLKAQGKVEDTGGGLLSRRGFVWLEGDSGDPELDLIPLANPSFEYGAPPTGWTAENSILSHEGTIVKLGSASIKIWSNGIWARAYQSIANYADYAGKRVTVGVWYYASSTNDRPQHLAICDGVGSSGSAAFTKDDAWHWITVSRTIDASPTMLEVRLFVNNLGTSDSNDVLYVDGAILVVGDTINAVFDDGEFSTGTYSLTIEGLEPDTSYRVRAFGENEAGISYGNTVTGKTLAAT